LTLKAGDPLHEKLVVQHAQDSSKLYPFQEWDLSILDKLEYPSRKLQPTQLPVDKCSWSFGRNAKVALIESRHGVKLRKQRRSD
jgi:hypothetical protein